MAYAEKRNGMAFACLLALFTSSECWAQVTSLKGLKSIHLLVEELNEESQRCGITQPLIHDAFMFPASSSKMHISNDNTVPIFYVHVLTILQGHLGWCVSHLRVELYTNQWVKLDYTDDAWVHMRLWQEEVLITSKIEDHGQLIRNNVENLTKKFLTEWNLANRP